MADQLIVKLGADTSEFKGQVNQAAKDATSALGESAGQNAGSRFASAFSHHIFGMRHLTYGLATALGLNFEHIAETFARAVTGVSKDFEESMKKVAEISEQTAAIVERNMAKRRTDSQNLVHDEEEVNRNLRERDTILSAQAARRKKMDEESGDGIHVLMELDKKAKMEEMVRLAELDKRNAELDGSIIEGDKKVHDEEMKYNKELNEDVMAAKEQERHEDEKRFHDAAVIVAKRKHDEQEIFDLKQKALPLAEQQKKLQEKEADLALQITQQGGIGVADKEVEIEHLKVINELLEVKVKLEEEAARKAKASAEIKAAEAKGVAAGLTPEEQAKVNARIKWENADPKTRGADPGLPTRTGGVVPTSGAFAQSSDKELEEVIRRTKLTVDQLARNPGSAFDYGNSQTLAANRNLLAAAERERKFREGFQRDLRTGGEQFARQNFKGNPLEFDRVLSQFTEKQDKGTKILQSLDDRLSAAGFGKGK